MKISNSKKQLAKIIHENGGWRGGAPFAAQGGLLGCVEFYASKPVRESVYWRAKEGVAYRFLSHTLLPNWHQTILSRDEYFHLYPAQDDVDSLSAALDLVTNENKHEHVDCKPTIERLAADYRNRKDYADRKQKEADAAKADAEAKRAELVAAGKALGLVLSVADVEPELVITGWRDLQVDDRIWVGDSGHDGNCPEGEYDIADLDGKDDDQPVGVMWHNGVQWPQIHTRGWRFIRRPAKGGPNA